MSVEKAIAARRAAIAKTGYRKEPSQAVKQTKKQFSRWQMIGGGAGGFILLVLIIMAACAPRTGSDQFGICKTFTELYVRYPETLSYDFVEQYEKAVRIGYTQIDASGQFRYSMMECSFRPDTAMGMAVDTVLLNRKPLDSALVTRFNPSLPAILDASPDLVLPPVLPEDIALLKR